jgi:sulfite reductase alpha subunit-like flavoprotein
MKKLVNEYDIMLLNVVSKSRLLSTASHLDVLKMFPNAKPNLATLVDFIPEIKPRLYSIASSTEYHGKDALHLLVVADEWTTSTGEPKHGLCTKVPFLNFNLKLNILHS